MSRNAPTSVVSTVGASHFFLFQTDPLAKLSSEPAIITVVFIAAGIAILKLLPSLIDAFRGNGKEKERADHLLSTIVASTTSSTANTAAVSALTNEFAGLRRTNHDILDKMTAYEKRAFELEQKAEELEKRIASLEGNNPRTGSHKIPR